jgi:hypothetical protein
MFSAFAFGPKASSHKVAFSEERELMDRNPISWWQQFKERL